MSYHAFWFIFHTSQPISKLDVDKVRPIDLLFRLVHFAAARPSMWTYNFLYNFNCTRTIKILSFNLLAPLQHTLSCEITEQLWLYRDFTEHTCLHNVPLLASSAIVVCQNISSMSTECPNKSFFIRMLAQITLTLSHFHHPQIKTCSQSNDHNNNRF